MDFGTFLLMPSPEMRPPAEVYARGVDFARAADALGFTHVWLAEHHFSNYSYLSRPVTVAAHLAARTERIRLGFAVLTVPFQHPLAIAEELATLDALSGGRVDAGFGRGYWQYAFDRLEVERESGRERFDEALDAILLALRGEPFSFHGKHYDIAQTRIFPQPVQKAMPLWVAAQSDDSVRDTIRRGMNVLSGATVPLPALERMRARYDELMSEYGNASCRFATQRPVYVAETEEEAISQAVHALWNARVSVSQRFDFGRIDEWGRADAPTLPDEPSAEEMVRGHMIAGTPDQCVEQLRGIVAALRPDVFNASFWFGDLEHDRVLRSMELFATEVMPRFTSDSVAMA